MTELTKKDKADKAFRQMSLAPLLFVEFMWGLVPQPVKEEYKDLVDELVKEKRYKEIKKEHFETFIKGEHVTWQQWIILLCVGDAKRGEGLKRISIGSGHGIGKSCVLSWLVLWFLYCHKEAQVPCTAPSSDQMYDILWKEISKWLKKMPEVVQSKYEWTGKYVRVTESPETWFARAKTARKESPEALAGIHAEDVMMIVDEGSGVAEEIFNTAEGALTSENILVVIISNCTRLVGYFYDTHHSDKFNWQNLQFDSEDSPIVDKKYVARIIEKHGEGSDEHRIRVKGLFPKEDAIDNKGYVALLNPEKICYTIDATLSKKKRMGIDPAGQGKDTTEWVVRDGFKMKVVASEKLSTPKTIAQKTLTLMDYYGFKAKDAEEEIDLDDFGVGAKTSQELALAGVKVNAVNVGDPADDLERFLNKRAEAYWRFREWLFKGGELVAKEKWESEINANRYRRTLKGKIQMMPKPIMRKEGIKSPNRMDAGMLTFVKEEVVEEKKDDYVQPDWEEAYDGMGV